MWMPLYIGDYLADTMHLNTEQHGAYLLLLFHLWRRDELPDEDAALAKISGLSPKAWNNARPVLASFFRIENGRWQHGRVERERLRVAAKIEAFTKRSQKANEKRWANDPSRSPQGVLVDPIQEPEPEPQPEKREKQNTSSRLTPFREMLAEYWLATNPSFPEMPWDGRDAKALTTFLKACPQLTEAQFRQMLANRARSPVAHGDRVCLWIHNLTRFQEEMSVYNRPASAENHGSRAEINRHSVRHAVNGAWDLAQEHLARAGETGAEPADIAYTGMPALDG